MQTILGAGGVIANNLVKHLPEYTQQIRLVSRNPKPVLGTEELVPADLLNRDQVSRAVAGSEVVYLTAGLTYTIKVWQTQWPVLMRNVLDACQEHGAKLAFFDNVYAYGRVNGWMTEDTPYNPCSKKGEVRAKIATMLMEEAHRGKLQALIVRGADFYGPNTPLSFLTATVFDNLRKGKAAQIMVNAETLHSFTYTPDAGQAMAILGNTPSAFNQIWHAPTAPNPLNTRQIVETAAGILGVSPKYTVLSRPMLRMVGWFVPVIRESIEMLYQNDQDYLFDSSKFNQAFGFEPMAYEKGIAAALK
ncbi:MAG: NAD-dependent epimerase/dehydratase family protein [Haliscomenobacter sp.]|nr:NAD-dependent epimerase/dehydratase family protein [Haliscomenobacter sp.]